MPKSERRDVVPSKGRKGWDVTKPGAKDPVSHHRTQSNAEQAAKRELRGGAGGEVVTHRRDGSIRDKDTMPPVRDPNPPKDRKH
ncbi:MAG: DUF2188 domain-containing protein [Actinomycetota bacterium]